MHVHRYIEKLNRLESTIMACTYYLCLGLLQSIKCYIISKIFFVSTNLAMLLQYVHCTVLFVTPLGDFFWAILFLRRIISKSEKEKKNTYN
jgi:hypothetical protein